MKDKDICNVQNPLFKAEIIINFMFSGNYLEDNIGHEIINFYKADATDNQQEAHYIYLCQDGEFNPDKHPNIERIFFVRRTGNSGEMEILGFTDGKLEYIRPQYRFIEKESSKTLIREAFDAEVIKDIRYGDACIQDIFKNNLEQQSINVTFKAEKVIRPQKSLFIHLKENGIENQKIFNASRNLRTYIQEGTTDYSYLNNKIAGINQYNSKPLTTVTTDNEELEITASEIWGIQDYELAYSNAIKFFVDKYPPLFKRLFEELCNLKNIGDYVQTLREWKNIDIIIEFEKAVIIIENKILSNLNGISEKEKNTTQLEKYYNTMMRKNESDTDKTINDKISYLDQNKTRIFLLLSPDHNDIDLSKHPYWKKIFYSDLYNHLKNCPQKAEDSYFSDFLRAISNHSNKDYHYTIMRKRFIKAINKVKNK